MKKRISTILVVAVLLLTTIFALVGCSADYIDESKVYTDKPTSFQVGDDGKFNYMVLTDTHFQSTAFSNGKTIDKALEAVEKEKPELVIITGDVVTPSNHNPKGAMKGFQKFAKGMEDLQIYWAMIYGNHDVENEILTDKMIKDTLSHCKYALIADDSKTSGLTDYVIDLKKGDEIVHSFIMMDSHSADHANPENQYVPIDKGQIDWYTEQITSRNNVKSSLFVHIPVPAFQDALNSKNFDKRIPTLLGEDKVYCSKTDNGFFDKIVELGSTKSITVGHDHNYNWLVNWKGVDLHYARVSGYTAWGKDKKVKPGYTMVTLNTNGTTASELYNYKVVLY